MAVRMPRMTPVTMARQTAKITSLTETTAAEESRAVTG